MQGVLYEIVSVESTVCEYCEEVINKNNSVNKSTKVLLPLSFSIIRDFIFRFI